MPLSVFMVLAFIAFCGVLSVSGNGGVWFEPSYRYDSGPYSELGSTTVRVLVLSGRGRVVPFRHPAVVVRRK